MKNRNLTLLLSLLALLLLAASPVVAQDEPDDTETAEIRAIIEEYIGNTMLAPATLEECTGMTGASNCKASDVAGFGLNCPQTSSATDDHFCSVETSEEIDASLTAFAKEVLHISGSFTTVFRLVSSESSVTHNHEVCADKAGTCAEKFVGRHEIITGFIAVYQDGKVSASLPESLGQISTYTAAVKAAKGRVIMVSRRHLCNWEDHSEPRTCYTKPTGPTTPGGTTGDPTGPTTPGGTTGEPGGTTTGGEPGGDPTEPGGDPTEPNLCEQQTAG